MTLNILAKWLVTKYLKRYIENVNIEELLKDQNDGVIELEELSLNKNELNLIFHPIKIQIADIARCCIKLPQISSEENNATCKITIDCLHLLLLPLLPQYDANNIRQEEENYAKTIARLHINEIIWQLRNRLWDFSEALQFEINDIHIRYEDASPITTPTSLACGITIERLHISNNFDENHVANKSLTIQNMAFYFDPNPSLIHTLSVSEAKAAFQQNAYVNAQDYILKPFNIEMSIKNPSAPHLPYITCNAAIESIHIAINELQYSSAFIWMYELERLVKLHKYKKWKSEVMAHLNQFDGWEKWQFIYNLTMAHIHQTRQRQKWSYVLQRAKDNVLYVKLYVEYLLNPMSHLASELQDHKDYMERTYDFEDLYTLQKLAMEKASKSAASAIQKSGSDITGTFDLLLTLFPTSKEWHSLADDVEMNFNLTHGAIALSWDISKENVKNRTRLELEFENSSLTYSLSHQSGTKKLHLQLGDLKLTKDLPSQVVISPLHQRNTNLISLTDDDKVKEEGPFFEMILETNPSGMKPDGRLIMNSRPLKIIFNADILKGLCQFFTKPRQDYNLTKSMNRFYEHFIQEIKNDALNNYQYFFSIGRHWDIHLNMSAPKIIFRESTKDDNNSISVICSLGDLLCDTEYLHSTFPVQADQESLGTSYNSDLAVASDLKTEDEHQSISDKYVVQLRNLQVYVCETKNEDNQQELYGRYFIDPMLISFNVERQLLRGANMLKPLIAIRGIIAKLHLNVNGRNIHALTTCFGQAYDIIKWLQTYFDVTPQLLNSRTPTVISSDRDTSLHTSASKTQDETTFMQPEPNASGNKNTKNFKWFSVEFHIAHICLHLNDYSNMDIPVFEININDWHFHQTVSNTIYGNWQMNLSIDFYNQNLSGWEPLVEPWTCYAFTEYSATAKPPLSITITSDDTLNVNLTSTIIDAYSRMQTKWTKDYFRQIIFSRVNNELSGTSKEPSSIKSLFVHYAVRNLTGCEMNISAASSKISRIVDQECGGAKSHQNSLPVPPMEVVQFEFEINTDYREIKNQKLVFSVFGWQPTSPLTVNRSGNFFRSLIPLGGQRNEKSNLPTTRLFISVELESSGRKLITVQSAVIFKNSLHLQLELLIGDETVRHLEPNTSFPIPLIYVDRPLSVRPATIPDLLFSNLLERQNTSTNSYEIQEYLHTCKHTGTGSFDNFNFFAHVKPLKCLMDTSPPQNQTRNTSRIVTFLPPITITNLLPCILTYVVSNSNQANGQIKPRNNAAIYWVGQQSSTAISFFIENFTIQEKLIIPKESASFEKQLSAKDAKHRTLFLNIKVVCRMAGCSRKVYVSVPYWFINKTGLPIIYGVDNLQPVAAGQFEDHEMASSATPMMFSFVERLAPERFKMRIGKSLHPQGTPVWCDPFKLINGIKLINMGVGRRGTTPILYSIGVEIREDPHPQSNTKIVTLTTRFELHNYSSYCLEYIQKYLLATTNIESQLLCAVPSCILPFHWSSHDQPHLLCVRIPNLSEHWSQGFSIDNVKSLPINIRKTDSMPVLIRAEITLQGATYHVVFTDADDVPPPIRLHNTSEVPIICKQVGLQERVFDICVMPHTSVSYCWDEPSLPAQMTCTTPGGQQKIYNFVDFTYDKEFISYKHAIYIEFTETFDSGDASFENEGLVLDVDDQGTIILSRKDPRRLSQYWRMRKDGKLEHVFSTMTTLNEISMVLDAANLTVMPSSEVQLRICQATYGGTLTQMWDFACDGRLQCKVPNYYIQPKGGARGLKAGNEVILCKWLNSNIPNEQLISPRKLPGSGFLGAYISRDGPTYVLQVFDARDAEQVIVEKANEAIVMDMPQHYFEVSIKMPNGIGLSLVNNVPEELVYAYLENIGITFVKSPTEQKLIGSISYFQVDNQTLDAKYPQVLYSSPSVLESPAIYFELVHVPSCHTSVEIFKTCIVALNNVVATIEEPLIWKLLEMFHYGNRSTYDQDTINESTSSLKRLLQVTSSALAKRYYLDSLKLSLRQVVFNVITSDNLTPELKAIKQQNNYGKHMPNLKNTILDFTSFERLNIYETAALLLNSVAEHYKNELWQQSGRIIMQKISSTVANSLGIRTAERRQDTQATNGELLEGNEKSLFRGLRGRLFKNKASTVKQNKEAFPMARQSSVNRNGVTRLNSTSSLDTDTAQETTSPINSNLPPVLTQSLAHKRRRRVCRGVDGLLPTYSTNEGKGQQLLLQLSDGKQSGESFVALEDLTTIKDGIKVLISSRNAYFMSSLKLALNTNPCILIVALEHLSWADVTQEPDGSKTVYFLMITTTTRSPPSGVVSSNFASGDGRYKLPCDSKNIAKRVHQQLTYAKDLYEDELQTVF